MIHPLTSNLDSILLISKCVFTDGYCHTFTYNGRFAGKKVIQATLIGRHSFTIGEVYALTLEYPQTDDKDNLIGEIIKAKQL